MSIFIKGMEMPTERESFNLTIKYNGMVLDTETGMQVAEAYELPPHGRLIDADALIELCRGHNSQRTMWSEIEYLLDNAPTIIEAEEGEA